jgi:hypothetical protein
MRVSAIRFVAFAIASTLILPAAGRASDKQWTCSSPVTTTFTVLDTDGHMTKRDVGVDGWEPVPLLEASFEVKDVDANEPTCVVAQLSSSSFNGINPWTGDLLGQGVAYQVRLDGDPMYGHTTACGDGMGGFFACIIMDNNQDPSVRLAGHSYHFVMPVRPGWHRIQVFYAGCCGSPGAPEGAYVGGTLLSVQHE